MMESKARPEDILSGMFLFVLVNLKRWRGWANGRCERRGCVGGAAAGPSTPSSRDTKLQFAYDEIGAVSNDKTR